MKVGLGSALALAAAVSLPVVVFGADDWKKEFQSGFASKNSWDRAAALKRLDPNNLDSLKVLLKAAKEEDWYLRKTVAEALASKLDDKAITGKALDELKSVVKKSLSLPEPRDSRSQEGNMAEVVLEAYGLSWDTAWVDDCAEVLQKSKDWKCRRSAAVALGRLPAKKGVATLVDCVQKEKAYTVFARAMESLEKVTEKKDYKTAAEWKEWWQGAEASWAPKGEKSADEEEEAKKAEENKSGDVLRTVSRGTTINARTRGNAKGRPLLVIPSYGYNRTYMETYLRNLEDKHLVIYVDLPKISDFDPKVPNIDGGEMPEYPIDRLADSFEGLRQELVKQGKIEDKPIALMAHAMSAWVAIRYASKYPKSIARLILMSTYASDRQWERSRKAMEETAKGQGEQELEHLAMWHSETRDAKGKASPRYSPVSEDDVLALHRKEFGIYFGNQQDLEIGRVYGPLVKNDPDDGPGKHAVCERRQHGFYIPRFDILKEPVTEVPTLILAGDSSYWGTVEDAQEIQKHYPTSMLQVFKGCGRMPMVEDNKAFIGAMEKFLH
jgi:pimeloyl-ACP methyl ester carboxylesterase